MKRSRILFLLFIIYMAVLLRITVFRTGFAENGFFHGTVNVSLFLDYIPLIQNGHWLRVIYLFVGNLIWFVPFGMYLQYIAAEGRHAFTLWRILLLGAALSLFIEVMQFVLGTGISELDDLILNTAGVFIGRETYRLFCLWRLKL